MAPWQPPWILEWNDFAILNLCVTVMPPIHQVSAQSDLGFRRRCPLKNFNMAALAAILDIGTNDFSNFESLCHCDATNQVSAQSKLGLGGDVAVILDIGMERF